MSRAISRWTEGEKQQLAFSPFSWDQFLHRGKFLSLRFWCPLYKSLPLLGWENFLSSRALEKVVVVHLLSCVQLFETQWTAAHQSSLSITNSQSLHKLMSLSLWCHPTISSSVLPFFSCPQSFPASGSFPMSWLFPSSSFSFSISFSLQWIFKVDFL